MKHAPVAAIPRAESPTRALLVLAVCWLVLYSPQLLAHQSFLFGDATLFRRFSEFSRERWIALHQRTFWNPYVFFGLPATASLADQRPQYLPDLALDVWERLRAWSGLPPLLVPLFADLAGILSTALLSRALWAAGTEAMIWAGLGWALMPGLIVPFTFGHDAQFLSASLIPAQLLLVHAQFAAASRVPRSWAQWGFAVLLGLQCLHGHPQMVAAGLALSVAFAVERAIHFRRASPLAGLSLSLVLGLGMGAASWWPALRYAALSVRGGPGGVDARDVADFSQSWRDLLSLAWPRAVGFGGATYWGGLRKTDFPQFAGTLICGLSLLAWPRIGRREGSAVLLLSGAAATGILLSLGSHLGGLDLWLREHLPLFANFRVSVVWLVMTDLALIELSALGWERVAHALEGRERTRRALVALCASASLALFTGLLVAFTPLRDLIAGLSRDYRPHLSLELARGAAGRSALDLAARGLLLGLACTLGLFARRGRWLPALSMLALALHSVDLGSVSVPFLLRTSGATDRLEAPPAPEIARLAAADPRSRALPLESDPPPSNDWVSWRARCAGGVHGSIYRDWAALMAAGLPLHYEALCALAVRYATVPGSTPERSELWSNCDSSHDGPIVIRLKHARDRAYCVPHVTAPGSRERVMDALFSPSFRASEQALADAPAFAGDYRGSLACRLRWLEDSPDRLRLAINAPAPAFLVIADAWFPGWTATLDGERTAIARVDYLVRGV
ncbi:MAG TPA: hypothetical protein VMJ70_13935, partial [Candidatus Sulfotelmatobacter sp.]|nr:hypothetical protein [Candidatus Sulfotelmatobacter sp.]